MGRKQLLPRGGSGDRREFGAGADDSGCPILHVDMDAFFASVEIRRRPELAGRPVVVGGVGPRGVVSSASYEARAYGVHSAMPTTRARRLCPQAVFLPPDFGQYTEASRAVMAIFRDVTPLVEPLSLDEAFLDVTGARRLLGTPTRIATTIRARVQADQGITCSVGVAPTKFVAKLASSGAKPDGLAVVPADRVLDYLHPMPVAMLWGVGERTAERLRRSGLETVRDLAHAPAGMLRSAVGAAAATHLHDLAWGRDPRQVTPHTPDKSIGAETTFDTDVADPGTVRQALLSLSEKTGTRLRRGHLAGRTVVLKLRSADFRTVTRSRTLSRPTDVAREIFETAWSLFEALHPDGGRPLADKVRLVGVRVEGLAGSEGVARQLALTDRDRGWREAEAAMDAAKERFGADVIRPASLMRGSRHRASEG